MIPEPIAEWLNKLDLEADTLVFDDADDYREATFLHAVELRKFARSILDVADKVEEKVAWSIDGQITLLGKRMRPTTDIKRRSWQSDDLLRAVLDSRVVDHGTGEVTDETPLDKVRAVWPLSGSTARITALRARDIEPDEYCEVEHGRRRMMPVK